MKIPSYYFHNSHKIKYSNCSFIPEAPRLTKSSVAAAANNAAAKKETSVLLAKNAVSTDSADGKDDGEGGKTKSPRRKKKSRSRSRSRSKSRSRSPRKAESPKKSARMANGMPPYHEITKEQVSRNRNLFR